MRIKIRISREKILKSFIILWCIHISKSSSAFKNGENSELLLTDSEDAQEGRLFFNFSDLNNFANNIILDNTAVFIVAAILGPLLVALPLLFASLKLGGEEQEDPYGSSGYGGGHGGSSRGHEKNDENFYFMKKQSLIGRQRRSHHHNSRKQRAAADTELSGKLNIRLQPCIRQNIIFYVVRL